MSNDFTDFLGPRFAGRRYLRAAEIVGLGIVASQTALDLLVANGKFPAPIRIGRRTLIYFVPEIVAVLAARAAERRSGRAAQPVQRPP